MTRAPAARPFTRGLVSQTDVRYRGQANWHEQRAAKPRAQRSSGDPPRPGQAGYDEYMALHGDEVAGGAGISQALLDSLMLDNDADSQSMPTQTQWATMTQDQRDIFIRRVARNRRLSAADAARLATEARTEDWNTVRTLVGSGLSFLTGWIHEENETRRQEIIANANAAARRQTGQTTGERSILDDMQSSANGANNANGANGAAAGKKVTSPVVTLGIAALAAKAFGVF
jgi:hypothetical protein